MESTSLPTPQVIYSPKLSPQTEKYSVGKIAFEALGDRLVIKEDEFKSGYECKTCGGIGKFTCSACDGNGRSRLNSAMLCKNCAGSGTASCPDCGGKGGLIVVPEDAQRRPTTGVIVSAGPKVEHLRVGQSVMYSNFAGHAVSLNDGERKVELRILHETEVLCRIEGHIELRTLRDKHEMTTV